MNIKGPLTVETHRHTAICNVIHRFLRRHVEAWSWVNHIKSQFEQCNEARVKCSGMIKHYDSLERTGGFPQLHF